MRSSTTFPARQLRRVCAFCRQQHQQQQQIAISRSLHTSSTLQGRPTSGPSLSVATKPRSYRSNNNVVITRTSRQQQQQRTFSASAITSHQQQSAPESKVAEVEVEEEANTNTDADADSNSGDKPKVPQNHYEFFPTTLPQGPPPAGPFDIDVRALRREFLSLQAGAHPDLHPAHMKARAQATSARINEAYKTLSHPLHRAQYVLSLRTGEDVAADETAKVEDPELLMLVLETRECIEEAESEGHLEGLRAENEERIEESVNKLGDMFARDDMEAAREEVVRLRYWMNIRESVDNWERGKPVVLEH
ncbi:Co-chaperone Hsc20 [Xylaria arbuscula]|nr:Co-chaperone Hsc20 [Xylaria arbuscula]